MDSDEGFVVQWYDPPTESWRNRGKYMLDADKARSLANKLFKLKAGHMAVRVRWETTVYHIRSTKE